MYKVAVTGATGFVGSFVANYLEQYGYQVFRFGRRKQDNILLWDITCGIYENDLKIDCVIHCAALADDWALYKESYATNVAGTQNVVNSFPDAEKFIYISSASVYDAFSKKVTISEQDCLGGQLLNAYSKTKLLGEKVVESSKIASRIVLRPHIVYGPGDTTVAPRIKKAIKFNRFLVIGDGKNRISFTHVGNLAQAIHLAIMSKYKGFNAYNITDGRPRVFTEALQDVKKLNNLNFKEIFIRKILLLPLATLLELVYRMLFKKTPPLLTRYIVDQMSSDHILDISKAKKELVYEPTYDVSKDFLL